MNFNLTKLVVILLMTLLITSCSNKSVVPNESILETTAKTEETQAADTEVKPFYIENFDLKALDGSMSSLYANKDNIIILNFWATWCKYCVQEMPVLDAIDKTDSIKVLAVSVGEDSKTVSDYIEKYGYGFDVFLDENSDLASQFNVTGFPTSIFIGPDFEFFYAYPGMLDETSLQSVLSAIEKLQSERLKK